MMNLEERLAQQVVQALNACFQLKTEVEKVTFQKTRKEFAGDVTLVAFPYTAASKLAPEATGQKIGDYLKANSDLVTDYNVVKGFLNLVIADQFYTTFFNDIQSNPTFAYQQADASASPVMIEYSSPNTNKPLHLGHVRNNLLGFSVASILEASGQRVVKVNLVNDRGVHICKSMLAWQKWGNGETPQSSGMKGDHLVGKYYVFFDKHHKEQVKELVAGGMSEEEAAKRTPLMEESQEMLRKWEAGDESTLALWKMMNGWVYEGFDSTYKQLGVTFDKMYYESNTYLLGKAIVEEGLQKGVLFKKEDGSVWIDLTAEGLDQKLLLRSDGTSVYMTQDLGTAVERANEFGFNRLVYVVGNEQDYHFKVLQLVLDKLGYNWAKGLYHLSYGMVELPHGKMKSREGTVVDADMLIEEMINTARQTSEELGKIEGMTDAEAEQLYVTLGLGALKYFILRVDPKKKMLFNPQESIDFHGNTGPFIQFNYVRIKGLLRKAGIQKAPQVNATEVDLLPKERELIKLLYTYPAVIQEAAQLYSPAHVAAFAYELAKEYSQYYTEVSILKEEQTSLREFRLSLSVVIAETLKSALTLLGIQVPERM